MNHITYPGNMLTPDKYVPSQYYRFAASCLQTTGGTLIDSKNQNKTGTDTDGSIDVNGGTSQAWTVTGFLHTSDGSGTAANATRVSYDTADLQLTETECCVLSFRLKATWPTAQKQFVGTYSRTTGTESGFRLAMLTNGTLHFRFGDGAGNGVADGTYVVGVVPNGVESTVTIVFDNATRKMNAYVDGVIGAINDIDYPAGFGSILNDSRGFCLGTPGDESLVATSVTNDWRAVNALVFPSIPSNLDQIARHFSSKPFHLLRDADITLS